MGHALPQEAQALQFNEDELRKLESVRKSRSEEKRRTQRAAFLLDSLSGQSDQAIALHHHVSRSAASIPNSRHFWMQSTTVRWPRPGKPRQLPDDAIAWVQNCACQKPKELGYSYELWTYRLLTAHVRQHCVAASNPGGIPNYAAASTPSAQELRELLELKQEQVTGTDLTPALKDGRMVLAGRRGESAWDIS